MEHIEGRNTEKAGSILLVALKLAPKSRELLTSIITKLTKPGDHVVGVHVLDCFFATDSREKFSSSTKQQLASTFQAVQGVYQGLCSIKQIELDIKIFTGCRLRKVLVEVAKEEKATKLILGSTECHGIRRKHSLAKYCSKRLPETCSILVVEHGNVIFEKNGINSCSEKTTRHLFGASRSMPHPSNKPKHTFEAKLFSQSFNGSENLLKNMWTSKPESAKLNACVLRGNMNGFLSSNKALPSSPVSVLRVTNFSNCRGNKLEEANPCWQPEKIFDRTQSECLLTKGSAISGEQAGKDQFPPGSCHKIDVSVEGFDQVFRIEQNLAKRLQSISLDRICKKFSYEELKQATVNFSPKNMVGKGGFSNVYQGTLTSGQQIAVKWLNQSADAEEEFLTEVDILTKFGHPYIVPLLGYCVDSQKQFLVYEFASNGDLEDYIHGEVQKHVLEWAERFKIALGTAQALSYLHDGSPLSVVHRDMKSSNILLTSNFEPQVSDFGLAKLAPASTTSITCTDVFGTFGYIAPEYFMFGKVNDKTDVYSYGVVLLELITGKPAVDKSKPKNSKNLVLWARPLLEAQKLDELVDPRLKGQFDVKQMNQMLLAASSCISQSPKSRPRMNLVVKLLCGEVDTMAFQTDHDDNDNDDCEDFDGGNKDASDDQSKEDYSTATESCEVRSSSLLNTVGSGDFTV